MFCQSCGLKVSDKSNFCPSCGIDTVKYTIRGVKADAPAFCTKCGAKHTKEAYCKSCGAMLTLYEIWGNS